MISPEDARKRDASVDSKDLLALLREALGEFLRAAAKEKFQAPLKFTVRDADNSVLREFTLARDGKIVTGRTDDANAVFVLPLQITVVDSTRRVARVRINASHMVEKAEFIN